MLNCTHTLPESKGLIIMKGIFFQKGRAKVLTAFLIFFFLACAIASSYVTAVFLMYLVTRFYLYAPYDVFAYLSCPVSATCIEFGAAYRHATLLCAADIFVTIGVVLPLLYFFRDKIKDKILSKIKRPAKLCGALSRIKEKIKGKIRPRPAASD